MKIGRKIKMDFLRWIGGIIVLVWLLGFLFSIGGALIHFLLVVAAIVFIVDIVTGKKNRQL